MKKDLTNLVITFKELNKEGNFIEANNIFNKIYTQIIYITKNIFKQKKVNTFKEYYYNEWFNNCTTVILLKAISYFDITKNCEFSTLFVKFISLYLSREQQRALTPKYNVIEESLEGLTEQTIRYSSEEAQSQEEIFSSKLFHKNQKSFKTALHCKRIAMKNLLGIN